MARDARACQSSEGLAHDLPSKRGVPIQLERTQPGLGIEWIRDAFRS
jgi:hypothetical protein